MSRGRPPNTGAVAAWTPWATSSGNDGADPSLSELVWSCVRLPPSGNQVGNHHNVHTTWIVVNTPVAQRMWRMASSHWVTRVDTRFSRRRVTTVWLLRTHKGPHGAGYAIAMDVHEPIKDTHVAHTKIAAAAADMEPCPVANQRYTRPVHHAAGAWTATNAVTVAESDVHATDTKYPHVAHKTHGMPADQEDHRSMVTCAGESSTCVYRERERAHHTFSVRSMCRAGCRAVRTCVRCQQWCFCLYVLTVVCALVAVPTALFVMGRALYAAWTADEAEGTTMRRMGLPPPPPPP